ncbi:hypothetical protein PHLGIDRAFT_64839 [Phlebiopsis gigantea 11061_1 CR5-6]|uniref:Pyridoxamine 5'-phosphate oxidase putative domain-containing protein n=1 Tax=Phlebiopsis gigantea (strain 11061_1 CR5-6) TaxID=745531 RepID=A0A0C3SEU4_PHLG1|nr:hypothetical protein PHLGIDRAFT_64839 [Phlebiopsis gigantea 11061_1 CR5-6]
MGEFYDEIPDDEKLIEWIKDQKIFHVASAPLKGGHVNVSPKGQPTFKLVNRKAVWYLDLTGSGNETISHMYEPGNGRMTILFEAFEGPPRILRLFGRGQIIERNTPEFDRLMSGEKPEGAEFDYPTPEMQPGARAIIWLDIEKVGTSCGYAVPFMKFEGHRDVLKNWSVTLEKNDSQAEDPYALPMKKGLKAYWLHFNTWSMDGLPGFKQVEHKANTGLVNKIMTDVGLDPSKMTNSVSMEKWSILLVGAVLGFGLSTLVNGNISSIAGKLLKT